KAQETGIAGGRYAVRCFWGWPQLIPRYPSPLKMLLAMISHSFWSDPGRGGSSRPVNAQYARRSARPATRIGARIMPDFVGNSAIKPLLPKRVTCGAGFDSRFPGSVIYK